MCHEEDKTKFKSSERSVPAGTCFGTPLQSCVNMADSDNTNQNQPPTRIMVRVRRVLLHFDARLYELFVSLLIVQESAQPISEMQLEQLQTSQREEEFQQDFDDFVTQNAGNVEELRSAYDNMSVEQFQQLQGKYIIVYTCNGDFSNINGISGLYGRFFYARVSRICSRRSSLVFSWEILRQYGYECDLTHA